MKKSRSSLPILWVVFGGMIFVCMYLSSGTQTTDDNLFINVCMFGIVGAIFIVSTIRFITLRKIAEELRAAADKIQQDFDGNTALWDKYKDESKSLFNNEILYKAYREFVEEEKRFESLTNGNYRCNIDDFINRGLLDATIKKSLCNLVAGAMTGLGILGTFIGLSLGLRDFNTGSAEDISKSIAPLMSGIKVAFHTSIYGMIFSLVFNFVYKHSLEQAYSSLDLFLRNYDLYVLRDSEYSNESDIHNLVRNIPEEIGNNINKTLAPAMENISNIFSEFAANATKNQLKGLSNIVDSFVKEMNSALGGNFERLGKVLDKTCEMQEKNNEYVQGLFEKVGGIITDIDRINELSSNTVSKMSEYLDKLDDCQEKVNTSLDGLKEQIGTQTALNDQLKENIASLNDQFKDNMTALNDQLKDNMASLNEQQKQIIEATGKVAENLEGQIQSVAELEKNISEETKLNMEVLTEQAKACREQMVEDSKASMDALSAQAKTNNEQMAEFAHEQMSKLAQFSEGQTTNMKQASEELSKVTKSLNAKLSESLKDTFSCFDSNLSEITQHLSGTIAEVDDTTKRVPSVVNAAYSGMEKSFKQMQIKIDTLVDAIDVDAISAANKKVG